MFLWYEIMQNVFVIFFFIHQDFYHVTHYQSMQHLDVCYFRILSEVSAFCVLTSRPKKKKINKTEHLF